MEYLDAACDPQSLIKVYREETSNREDKLSWCECAGEGEGEDSSTVCPCTLPPPANGTNWQLAAINSLCLYVAPVLILAGTLGNVLSFAILQTKVFRGNACRFLLSAMVCVDTGTLMVGLLPHWIAALTGYELNIRDVSNIGCKVFAFSSYLFPQLSAWTLLLMTLDRLIYVLIPLRARFVCNKHRFTLAWIATSIVLIGYNLHLIFISEMFMERCSVKTGSTDFYLEVLPYMDYVMAALLPSVVISVSNGVIIYKIFHSRTPVTQTRSYTITLIVLSIDFLVTTAPSQIFFIGLRYWPKDPLESCLDTQLAYYVCLIVYNFHCAFNFVLYCLSGKRFRLAILSVFCCKDVDLPGRRSTYSRRTVTTLRRQRPPSTAVSLGKGTSTRPGSVSSQTSVQSTDTTVSCASPPSTPDLLTTVPEFISLKTNPCANRVSFVDVPQMHDPSNCQCVSEGTEVLECTYL